VQIGDPRRLVQRLADNPGESSDYDLNPEIRLARDRPLRPAAVLIVLWDRPDGAQLILTKRSSRLQHHPGQIALPGGKVDAGDAGPVAAALREAWEEVGLPPERTSVLGNLPPHETVTGFLITPVVARLMGDFTPVAEAGEVAEVFTVPLSHVTDPARFRVEHRQWRGGWRRYHVVPYGPYYIWGATARILRGLADRLAE
jgi:8-oxo-dGTP pyrophosphatase MutT (NUDIX family)